MPVSAAFSVVLSRGQQLLHLGNNICHRDSPARRASKAAVLCASDHGKGRKDRHQQNMLPGRAGLGPEAVMDSDPLIMAASEPVDSDTELSS